MRRTMFVSAGVVLTLIGLVVASQTSRTTQKSQTTATQVARPQFEVEKAVPTQQRMNRYFHNDVMPKLKNCWSGLQGKGSVEFEHNYTKGAGGKWVPGSLVVSNSSLPKAQVALAQKCMQDATRGTSFPADGSDGSSYVLRWTWPVPFPPNAPQLTTAMFAARMANNGGGGGGCDGAGTLAKCYTCDKAGHECEKVCVGYKECKLEFPGRLCGAQGSCASGGPFGFAGSRVMY